MTSGIGDTGNKFNIQVDVTKIEEQPPEVKGIKIHDTVVQMDGGQFRITHYAQDANHPVITPPNPNVQEGTVQADPALENLGNFYSALDPLLQQQPEKFEELLFALYNPDDATHVSAETRALLNGHVQQAKQQAGLPSDWDPMGYDPETYKEMVNDAGEALFEQELKKYNLSPEDEEKVKFAFYTKTGSPKSVKIAQEIEGAVKKSLDSAFPIRDSDVPKDAKSFQELASLKYDDEVLKSIQEEGQKQGLSKEEINQIISSYYKIDSTTLNSAQTSILEGAKASAQASISSFYGAPSGWQPLAPDPTLFLAGFDADFRLQVESQLKGFSLSEGEMKQVRQEINQLINGKSDAKIPENLRTIASQIFSKSVDAVRTQNGLPLTWNPVGEVSVTGPSQRVQMAQNMLTTLQQQVTVASQLVASMPNDPNKVLLINFLKVIGEAISELEQMVRVMELKDGEKARTMSKAQISTIEEKYKTTLKMQSAMKVKRAEIQQKQQEAEEKQKTMGIVMLVVGILVSAVLSVFGGPAGIALGAILITASIVQYTTDVNIIAEISEVSVKLLEAIGIPMNDQAKAAVKFLTLVCVVVAATVLSGGAGLALGAQFFFESEVIEDLTKADMKAKGASEKEIEKTAQTARMATQICVEVVMMVALAVITCGAGVPLIAAKIVKTAGKIGKVAVKVTKFLGKHGEDILMGVEATFNTAAAINNVNIAYIRKDILNLRADLGTIKAEGESEMEVLQGIIDMLRQMIDKLLLGLSGAGSWGEFANELAEFQKDKYAGHSQTLNNLQM